MNKKKEALEKFCPDCLEYTFVKPIKLRKTFQIKDEEVEIEAKYFKCEDFDHIIPDPELEEENYQKAYSEYRRRKGLLHPSEIIALREKYGISQRQLAKILGWSHVTLSRYENGAIQNTSHNNELVLILDNPNNLLKLLELNSSNMNEKEVNKLRNKINKFIESNNNLNTIVETFFENEKNIYNGFRNFDLNKFTHVIKFFAIKDSELYKMKLMKYLWYSDFLNFKRTTLSITGLSYVRLPMGPVPNEYDLIISLALKKDEIKREYIDFDYPHLAELFKPNDSNFDETIFEANEIEVLNIVYNTLHYHSSSSISDYSYKELGWINTEDKKPISYEYAFELSLD